MKNKMTTSELKQYVIAEAKRLYKIEVLKEQKSKIDKELKMLNENSINDNNLDMIYNLVQSWVNNGSNWKVEYQGSNKKNNSERFSFTMYFSDKKNKGPYLDFHLLARRDEEDGNLYFNTTSVDYINGEEYKELGYEIDLFPTEMTQIIKGEMEEVLFDQYGHHEDDDDRDDDYDSGMSSTQQAFSDRLDYARKKLEKGDWDKEQADEFRRGA